MEAAFEVHAGLIGDTIEIPLLGVVAAGEPYRAFVIDDTLSVPAALWGGRKVFALRVRGNSMIDEGIHDGDFLVVQPCAQAESGQTVVAEIDGCVTVKKFYREADGAIRLQPANPELLPLVIRGDDICIRGVVVGVMRKYGFGKQVPARPVARPSMPRRPADPPAHDSGELFELSLNAIDEQLAHWRMAIAHARRDQSRHQHLVRMGELERDLQALRDWLGRTDKAGLRRALIAEANKIIRRMQRLAGSANQGLGTETLLH
ncbi:MAG: repressor LexA [Deltaproteobacteria bacterium]|nr:repressor LexA [Deltaproteobacteria bacterium]